MLDNVKEIKFCWDWSYITIPKEEIKLLKYHIINEQIITNNSSYIKCDYVDIEINLDYLKNNYEEDHNLFDILQKNNIWSIEIIKEDKFITLELPTYRRESYFTNKYYFSMDAPNLCEKHSTSKNSYKIEWHEPTREEMTLTYDELIALLKNGILSTYYTQHEIGIELFEKILNSNIKNRNLKVDSFNLLRRIRESNLRTKKLYRRKLSYQAKEEYDETDGIEKINLNFTNHTYKWNLTFLFVNENENKKLNNTLEKLSIPDTTHYFHRTILIFKDEEKIKEFKNTYQLNNEELFLFTTVDELNELWYHIHKEANLA